MTTNHMSFFTNFFGGGDEEDGGNNKAEDGGSMSFVSETDGGSYKKTGRRREDGVTSLDTDIDGTQQEYGEANQTKSFANTNEFQDTSIVTEEKDGGVEAGRAKGEGNEGGSTYSRDNVLMAGEQQMEGEERNAEDLQPWKVGQLTCCCKPTRASGIKDMAGRMLIWTLLNKNQFLSGLSVAIAQVPEIVSYAILAGIDPMLALQGSWITGVVTTVFGGRPGIINGPTASVAIALINLVANSGPTYVMYAVAFAGLLQIASGFLNVAVLLRFVPFPAMVGFMNIMSVITVFNQVKFLKEPGVGANAEPGDGRALEISWHTNNYNFLTDGTPWVSLSSLTVMLVEAAVGFIICLTLPKLTKIVPSTFVAIFVVTVAEWALVRQIGYKSTLVGDYTGIESALPTSPIVPFEAPPLNLDTFQRVWPAGLSVFAVSTVESLLTHSLLNGYTNTKGSPNRMAVGQGLGNLFTSVLVGGMGGGAMVGQSVLNNKSQGVSGLSSFLAAFSLFVIAIGAAPAVGIVPLAAVSSVMFYAAFHLLQWHSFITILAALFPQRLRDLLFLDCKVNRWDTFGMLSVMAMTFFFDIAMGMGLGAIIGALSYAWDSSNSLMVDRVLAEGEETVTYRIKGPLCFASSQVLEEIFTDDVLDSDPGDVILLLEDAEIFDWSGMVALKELYNRIEAHGKTVALSSLSPASKKIMEKNSSMWYGVVFLEMQEIEETADDQQKEDQLEDGDGGLDTEDVEAGEAAAAQGGEVSDGQEL